MCGLPSLSQLESSSACVSLSVWSGLATLCVEWKGWAFFRLVHVHRSVYYVLDMESSCLKFRRGVPLSQPRVFHVNI